MFKINATKKIKPFLNLVVLASLVLAVLGAVVLPGRIARAASLVQITGFGTNPTGLIMNLYVPASAGTKPAILLAIHYCTGSGPAFFSGTQFASLADQYGFIVIYPSAPRNGQCWDVSSSQALTRNGGSDPVGLMSMVTYVEQHNNGDPNWVYVTGASSGAMMTNVMLADYPDVFKAGAAFMGVPDTCFTASAGDPTNPANQAGWNSTCANGQSIKTAQQWGDLARGAFPGYSGARPRMQLWHGTADPTLNYANFGEEIKQWTNVLGVSQTPSFTDTPQSGWTRTRYGSTGVGGPVEAISVSGAGHVLPLTGQAAMAIQFFGLDGSVVQPTATRTATQPTGPTATRTNTPLPGATATRTNTPLPGATSTPTRTPTPGSTGSTCSPVTSTITAPFTFDGAGTFCWQSSSMGSYTNNWNTTSLTINGVNETNIYVASSAYPAKINGFWYVSYSSSVAWGHFEAK